MKLYFLIASLLVFSACSQITDVVNETFKSKTAEELSYDEEVIFIPLMTSINGVIDTINIGELLDENDVSRDQYKGFEIDELVITIDSIPQTDFEGIEGIDLVGITPIEIESGAVLLNRSSTYEFPEENDVSVVDIEPFEVASYFDNNDHVEEVIIDYNALNTVFGNASLDDNTIIKISMKRTSDNAYQFGGFHVTLVMKMHFYVI